MGEGTNAAESLVFSVLSILCDCILVLVIVIKWFNYKILSDGWIKQGRWIILDERLRCWGWRKEQNLMNLDLIRK